MQGPSTFLTPHLHSLSGDAIGCRGGISSRNRSPLLIVGGVEKSRIRFDFFATFARFFVRVFLNDELGGPTPLYPIGGVYDAHLMDGFLMDST